MSKDIHRASTQTVESKYFTSKLVMDESLSDFKEPKKLAAIKPSIKTKPDKPKKAPKRIRGQKDIRTALHPKKNELESYAKDFETICQHAGLDVDSEQLQLAIALSKSLHPSTSTSDPEISQPLSSQDRVSKIRTTLLEYGFRVPEIKKKTSRRLKTRKNYKLLLTSGETKKQVIANKYSQLLFQNVTHSKCFENINLDVASIHLYHLTTSASYSILKRIDTFYVNGLLGKSASKSNLLRDWSEIPGRPVSPKVCELRTMDFSEIQCSQEELDIVLSGSLESCRKVINSKEKEALDKLGEKRQIFSTNVSIEDKTTNNFLEMVDKNDKLLQMCNESLENPIVKINQSRSCSPDLFDDEPSALDGPSPVFSQDKVVPNAISDMLDLTKCYHKQKYKENIYTHTNTISQLSQNVTKIQNNSMEITSCVDTQYLGANTINKITVQLSQEVTKMGTNNCMEITDCVSSLVEPIPIETGIDLTQSPENQSNTADVIKHINGVNQEIASITVQLSQEVTKMGTNDCMEITDCVSSLVEPIPIETGIDLTQSPENQSNTADVIKHINGVNQEIASDQHIIVKDLANANVEKAETLAKVALEENDIDLTESPEVLNVNNDVEKNSDRIIESLDLTQSSSTSDELPFVSLTTNLRNCQEIVSESADNTIIIDPKDYEGISQPVFENHVPILNLTPALQNEEINHDEETAHNLLHSSQGNNNEEIDLTQNFETSEIILDLTQEVVMVSRHNSKPKKKDLSFFEEFDHNHSSNNSVHEEIDCDVNVSKSSSKENVCTRNSTKISECITKNNVKSTMINKDNDINLTQNSELLEAMDVSLEESDIDLTQNTSTSEDLSQDLPKKDSSSCPHIINIQVENSSSNDSDSTVEMVIKSSQRCSSLGKKDDISIDYDELYDRNNHSNSQHSSILNMNEPNTPSAETEHNHSNISNKSKDISNCSQDSEVFVISDNELDYSMHQSKLERPLNNFELGGISIIDDISGVGSFRRYTNIVNSASGVNSCKGADDIIEVENYNSNKTPVKHKRFNELSTPQKASCSGITTIVTPSNHEYVIKTDNITPKLNYEVMSLEEIHKELDDFGIKPFKRKRAIQLLTHIYNQTHPTIDPKSDESPCKKRKKNDYESPRKSSPRQATPRMIISPKKTAKSPRKVKNKSKDTSKESASNIESEQDVGKNYEVAETPTIKEIECSPADWVFQKREKAKVHSCRVPLHIAFHNYVSSRRELREAILCYEPINIDVIHKNLVAYGHRYDPKELLKFMDKKCITVKTTDSDGRNQNR